MRQLAVSTGVPRSPLPPDASVSVWEEGRGRAAWVMGSGWTINYVINLNHLSHSSIPTIDSHTRRYMYVRFHLNMDFHTTHTTHSNPITPPPTMTDLLDTAANQEAQGRSRRTRVKSQRALESEQTDRILARAKTQQRAGESSTAEASTSTSAAVAPPAPKRAKGKAKKQDGQTLYCICKTDGEDGRPMIECGICNDW